MNDRPSAPANHPTSLDAHAIDILCDLVATPSPSDHEAVAVARFAQHARALGLSAHIDEAGSGIATRGDAGDPRRVEIVLLGHIDTVPGDIPVRLEEDADGEMVLHGRGSVDAKGPLAALLVAAARATLPPSVTLRVCAAVGEETSHSRGARHIARSFRPHACIIGEPSAWDGVTLGYKGRLVARLDIAQPCHHSAGPGDSAPDAAHAAWSRVLELVTALNRANTAGDAPPRAFDIIQSSLRSLASTSDGLTDRASLVGGFRLPRWITPHELESQIAPLVTPLAYPVDPAESRASGAAQPRQNAAQGVSPGSDVPPATSSSSLSPTGAALHAPRISLSFEGHEMAHAVDRNDPVARALSTAIRSLGATPRPKLKTGTADLNVVAPIWNCPIAAYGPGDSSLDHTPVERLSISEYLRSIRVLTHAIQSLANELVQTRPGSVMEARPTAHARTTPGASV